jgi:hypothetical protein
MQLAVYSILMFASSLIVIPEIHASSRQVIAMHPEVDNLLYISMQTIKLAFECIEHNNVQSLQKLIKHTDLLQLNAQHSYKNNHTLLGYAIVCHKISCTQALLQRGVNINVASGNSHEAPIFYAIRRWPTHEIESLLYTQNLRIDTRSNYFRRTILHELILYKHTTLIEPWIRRGARVNDCNAIGDTALDIVQRSSDPNGSTTMLLKSYNAHFGLQQQFVSDSYIRTMQQWENLYKNDAIVPVHNNNQQSHSIHTQYHGIIDEYH